MDLEVEGFEYLGCGPGASGAENGWNRAVNLYYRCGHCGDIIKSLYQKDYTCSCGSMDIDQGSARFGSRHGDMDIHVYRKAAKI